MILEKFRKRIKDFTFVAVQLLLFILYGLSSGRDFNVLSWISILSIILSIIALAIILLSILQLNKSLSPFPSPVEGASLITNGLYGYVRHPIYSGILLFALSYSIYSGNYLRFIITLLLLILFHYKSKYEEELLIRRYKGYEAYMLETGRLFPKF